MGTTTETIPAFEGGTRKTVSAGAIEVRRLVAKHLMGATYATNGDTVTLPAAPAGCTLFAVNVLSHDGGPGIDIRWNHSTSTPKLLVHDEDNTSGVAAELANGSAAMAAVVVFLEFIYTKGR